MWRKSGAILVIGLCIIVALDSLLSLRLLQTDELPSSLSPESHRFLKVKANSPTTISSWAKNYLKPLASTPKPSAETVLFWCVPKSGTSTVKAIYKCMDQTIANHAGTLPKYGHDHDEELVVFRPGKNAAHSFVNVDTASKAGILRAKELGLVPSGLADIIFTGSPDFAVEHLYDRSHKGRILGLFRHPVERIISKFYYLQVADWEKGYHPEWKELSILDFATNVSDDSNRLVRQLAGKPQVTEEDLQIAMKTVKRRFIVGLTNQMEESIRRFNVVIGIDESDEKIEKCMDQFFGHSAKRTNSNPHPRVEEGSPAWKALAERNVFDIQLYDFVVQLFEEQKEIIDSYSKSMQ